MLEKLYVDQKSICITMKDRCSIFFIYKYRYRTCICLFVVFQTVHDFQMKESEEKALKFILKKGRGFCLESFNFLHLSAECL